MNQPTTSEHTQTLTMKKLTFPTPILLLCSLNPILCVRGNDATVTCLEPDIEELTRQLPGYVVGIRGLHPSFFNVDELTQYIKRSNGYINSTLSLRYKLHGQSSCHVIQQTEARRRGNLCPSYFVLEHDPGRIPPNIVQAECTCRSCLFVDEVPGVYFMCTKIWSHTQVLRRTGCNNGVFSYRYAWEKVSVGCACSLV